MHFVVHPFPEIVGFSRGFLLGVGEQNDSRNNPHCDNQTARLSPNRAFASMQLVLALVFALIYAVRQVCGARFRRQGDIVSKSRR